MRPQPRPLNRALQYPPPAPPALTACAQCAGKGLVALHKPGKPHTASMARCEECSGFGRLRA